MHEQANGVQRLIARVDCSKSTVRGERGLVESPFIIKCFKGVDNQHRFMLD